MKFNNSIYFKNCTLLIVGLQPRLLNSMVGRRKNVMEIHGERVYILGYSSVEIDGRSINQGWKVHRRISIQGKIDSK